MPRPREGRSAGRSDLFSGEVGNGFRRIHGDQQRKPCGGPDVGVDGRAVLAFHPIHCLGRYEFRVNAGLQLLDGGFRYWRAAEEACEVLFDHGRPFFFGQAAGFAADGKQSVLLVIVAVEVIAGVVDRGSLPAQDGDAECAEFVGLLIGQVGKMLGRECLFGKKVPRFCLVSVK